MEKDGVNWLKHIFLGIVALLILLLGFFFSYHKNDPTWFARSGSVIVILGIIVEGWIILTTGDAKKMPVWSSPEGLWSAKMAIGLVCLGTLVWGWGELIELC